MIDASASVPIVALAPLAIVWFGIGPGSKVAIAALMTFFPTFVATLRGLTSLDPRGESGNAGGCCKVLKGGSWMESNPANKRSATRRYSRPNITADEDSGFRCARNVTVWPDVDTWLSHLH